MYIIGPKFCLVTTIHILSGQMGSFKKIEKIDTFVLLVVKAFGWFNISINQCILYINVGWVSKFDLGITQVSILKHHMVS
jgi:hypothetical protein